MDAFYIYSTEVRICSQFLSICFPFSFVIFSCFHVSCVDLPDITYYQVSASTVLLNNFYQFETTWGLGFFWLSLGALYKIVMV